MKFLLFRLRPKGIPHISLGENKSTSFRTVCERKTTNKRQRKQADGERWAK